MTIENAFYLAIGFIAGMGLSVIWWYLSEEQWLNKSL